MVFDSNENGTTIGFRNAKL